MMSRQNLKRRKGSTFDRGDTLATFEYVPRKGTSPMDPLSARKATAVERDQLVRGSESSKEFRVERALAAQGIEHRFPNPKIYVAKLANAGK